MAYNREQFRDHIRQRLGWPLTDSFIDDDTLNDWVDASLRELHALLVTLHGEDFGWAKTTITTTPGVDFYPLPADFGRLIRVDCAIGSQYLVPFTKASLASQVFSLDSVSWEAGSAVSYFLRIGGDTSLINFNPKPGGVYDVGLYYVRKAPRLVDDASTSWLGDDEYVVIDCCIKCCVAQEQDSRPFVAQKAAYQDMLTKLAKPLDIGQPPSIVDARSLRGAEARDFFWPRGVR